VNQTWAGTGSYDWEINRANGTVGADPGWDSLLSTTGTLTITATGASQFNLNVFSLLETPVDTGGVLSNFTNTQTYTWLIADFLNPVSGFDATAFNINLTQFDSFNSPYPGTFSVALGGTGVAPGDNSQVYLVYVPEPTTLALLGAGVAIVAFRFRKRFRAKA